MRLTRTGIILCLPLAVSAVAHAQSLTLDSGDVVTVSGAGTHGTLNNSTTAYTDNGSSFYAVQTNGTAVFSLAAGGSLNGSAGNYHNGLDVYGSGPVTITGGTFTTGSSSYALGTKISGSIDLYGVFNGLTLGQTLALPTDPNNGATGSFTGTLQNNTSSQAFTYRNLGTITLHNLAAAPEPSQFAAFGIGLLTLGALALKARKRQGA